MPSSSGRLDKVISVSYDFERSSCINFWSSCQPINVHESMEGIHLLSMPELGITTRISHPCVVIVLCAAARAALHASKQTTFATRVACTYALAIVSLFTTADCKPSDCHIHVLLYDSNSLAHDLN